MNQSERRVYLIEALLRENPKYRGMPLPKDRQGQKDLLRALMNVRMPGALSDEYQKIEGEYLTQENAEKGIVSIDELTPVQEGIYLWQGDITRLSCDAIVNAANSQLLGCFHPLHNCIDNQIHTSRRGFRCAMPAMTSCSGRDMRNRQGRRRSPPPIICPAAMSFIRSDRLSAES